MVSLCNWSVMYIIFYVMLVPTLILFSVLYLILSTWRLLQCELCIGLHLHKTLWKRKVLYSVEKSQPVSIFNEMFNGISEHLRLFRVKGIFFFFFKHFTSDIKVYTPISVPLAYLKPLGLTSHWLFTSTLYHGDFKFKVTCNMYFQTIQFK